MERFIRFLVLVTVMLFGIIPIAKAQVPFDFHAPFVADETFDGGGSGTYYNEGEYHVGNSRYCIDFNQGSGNDDLKKPVVAVADGTVVANGSGQGYHTAFPDDVAVEHTSGYYSLYMHLQSNIVTVGQEVLQGQVIGYIGGQTGFSPHLHFCIYNAAGQSVMPSPMDGTVYDDAGAGRDVTSTNNLMFSEVEDFYDGFIGPATDAVHFYQSWDTLPYAHDIAPGAEGYTPDDVYTQDHDDSGTSPGTSAIIYDAFGGARKAYLVRSGFWGFYDECGGPNGDCSGVSDSGASCTANPNVHDCGAPINDEYQQSSNEARQDFQSCYLYWDGDCVTANTYPVVAPGWTQGGWNSTYSYAFAEAYENNGARSYVGEATSNVSSVSGYQVQYFSGGSWGSNAIMLNGLDNNAYVIRSGFWDKYQALGTSNVGYPCEDEYSVSAGAEQEFQKLRMFWDGSTVTTTGKSSNEYGCQTIYSATSTIVSIGDLYDLDGTVYWYDGRSLRGVVSVDAFNACGFDWGEIQESSHADLSPLGWGELVDDPVDCGVLKHGDVFTTDQTTTVYHYTNGLKRGITSGDVFTACGFDWSAIQTFPGSTVTGIPDGSVINSSLVCYLTPDLVWRELLTGNMAAWFMDGTSVSSGASLSSSDLNWSVVGSGDFSRDGSIDLLWRHTSSPYEVYLWEMDGSTVSSSILIAGGTDPDWVIRGVSDFTSDGEPDILWKDQSTGELSLWIMEGTTVSSSETVATSTDTTWDIRAMGDLTGDQHPDILWRNPTSGALSLWQMDGTSYVSSITIASSSLTNWDVEAIGDFTSDGQNDLLWRNPTTGEMGVWEMDGTSYVSSLTMTSSDPGWELVSVGEVDGN